LHLVCVTGSTGSVTGGMSGGSATVPLAEHRKKLNHEP
jgi:hypothetical protein